MKKILICFAAGCLGGATSSLVAWFFGDSGIASHLGVAFAPRLSPAWLYPRIVWGGIWGMLFLLPLWKSRPVTRGTLFSLVPTAVQLLYIYPVQVHKGIAGVELGIFMPLLVLFINWIWGLTASLAIRLAR